MMKKNITSKNEIIKINNEKCIIPKNLDEKNGVIKKQVFNKCYKNVRKQQIQNKRNNACKKCENNEQGYCKKYTMWCNLCSSRCVEGDKGNTYVYRDENKKKHIIYY